MRWMFGHGQLDDEVGMERFIQGKCDQVDVVRAYLTQCGGCCGQPYGGKVEWLSEKLLSTIVQHGSGSVEILNKPAACGHKDCYYGKCNHVIEKKRRFSMDDDDEEPWLMDVQDYAPMDMPMEMPMNPMGYGMSMMPTDNFVG